MDIPNARLFYSKTRCDRFVRDVLRASPLHLNSRRPTLQRIFDCLTQSFQFGINKTGSSAESVGGFWLR